jgi:hypothetical protein
MEQGPQPQQEILTCRFQLKVFFGIKQQQNSTESQTYPQNWKGTGTYIYIEKISTLFVYILPIPMSQFTIMLTLQC